MHKTVAAGLVALICEVGESYGLQRAQLLDAAGVDPSELEDADALVACSALFDAIRLVMNNSGDAALGLRIAAAFDLRRQGFWGYAVLSSTSMRDRIELYRRYQLPRLPMEFALKLEGQYAQFDLLTDGVPSDVLPILLDWGFARVCANHKLRVRRADPQMEAWLSCPERPHHRELRAIIEGPVTFGAALDRLQLRVTDLGLQLDGDPHLTKLALGQLDRNAAAQPRPLALDVLAEVRARIDVRLRRDPSLERVARDLGLSTRTLRRQLSVQGSSFQALLDDARRKRALEYLTEHDWPVERVAARLGYADSSSFRRAFRRWTGLAPHLYRDAPERMRHAGAGRK